MDFKSKTKRKMLVVEMAVPKAKRENVLQKIRNEINNNNYQKAAEIFVENGGKNLLPEFLHPNENGLNTQEANEFRKYVKRVHTKKKEDSKAELSPLSKKLEKETDTTQEIDNDFISGVKDVLKTLTRKYKNDLSVLRNNPKSIAGIKIVSRDKYHGVMNSKEYRAEKIAEMTADLKTLNQDYEIPTIGDIEFEKLSIDEKKEYMSLKKEKETLKKAILDVIDKYRKENIRKKIGANTSTKDGDDKLGDAIKNSVKDFYKLENVVDKYNKGKSISKTDLEKFKEVVKQVITAINGEQVGDKTETMPDGRKVTQKALYSTASEKAKDLKLYKDALLKANTITDNDFEDGLLDIDKLEDLMDPFAEKYLGESIIN